MLISKFNLYKREWLDLVFSDRNKSYGAYELRNTYGDNMLKAMAITIAGFTAAFITISFLTKHEIVPDEHQTTVVIQPPPIIKPIKIEDPVEAKVKPKTHVQTHVKPVAAPAAPMLKVPVTRFVPPVITTLPVKTEPVSQTTLVNTGVGTETIKGTATTNPGNVLPGGEGKGDGTGPNSTNTQPYEVGTLDVLPEPVGGTNAWSKFLQKNLRYPQTEAQGRVMVSFIIEKDGHLTDITILKGVAPELDNEALRVLKLAPAWKPGYQNGRAVRVKFTVPIVFQMNEQ